MSSAYVRNKILEFIEAQATTETLVDLTSDFQELEDLLTSSGVPSTGGPWLGVQFVGSSEEAIDVGATNAKGTYRESGIIFLHIVDIAKIGGHTGIITRADNIRAKFRGQRIADKIIIESVSPPTFGSGATLSFDGGYTAALIQIEYHTDVVLS